MMKLIRKISNGEHFIECPHTKWNEFWLLWKKDHSRVCPMVEGHRMFKHPERYGCEFVADLPYEDVMTAIEGADDAL